MNFNLCYLQFFLLHITKITYTTNNNASIAINTAIADVADKIASENSGKTVVVATHAGVVRSFLRKYNKYRI